VSGGLTLREGMVILDEVYNGGNMVSMDIVEINPDLGTLEAERRTGNIAKQLISNAFGFNHCPAQQERPVRN
jgi:arginase